MTSSISSRVQLLMLGSPLDKVPSSIISENEEEVKAWQFSLGEELAREGLPFGFVVLVVEGSLRITGRDFLGQEFTLRRMEKGQWWGGWSGLNGFAAASCRTAEDSKLLAVPFFWLFFVI